jgi:hypothetical protein
MRRREAISLSPANSGHTQPLPNLRHCGHSTPEGYPLKRWILWDSQGGSIPRWVLR